MQNMDELLNKAPCGFLAFADDGKIVAVNATLLHLLGYDEGELDGHIADLVFSAAARIFFQTQLYPLLKLGGKGEELYLELCRKNGSSMAVLMNAARTEQDGTPVNICIFVPMSRRTQYEEEILRAKKAAEEASRLKDEFLATVSHELRTPLNAMLGWVHMLRHGHLNEQRAAHAMEVIERNARAQAQLIEDLLDVSRIVSGNMRLDVHAVDPRGLIHAAVESVRPAAEAKDIKVLTFFDAEVDQIAGDAERLQQIVWNLLSNAVKFTPNGGQVEVRLERTEFGIELTVTDSGIGIKPEFLPHVFERFRQADQSPTRRHGGLGLGLSIVRHLVELHGGAVSVDSAGEGLGASFKVTLPLSVRTRAAPKPIRVVADNGALERPAAPRSLEGVKLLAVEDDADARDMLETALRQYGIEVRSAGSAQEGLALLSQWQPDVLVSDIGLPKQDGYRLIRQVRQLPAKQGGRIPAVALTAYIGAADRMKVLQSGYQMHVAKPVVLAELLAVIASVLDRNH